jgi:hypothetical protein
MDEPLGIHVKRRCTSWSASSDRRISHLRPKIVVDSSGFELINTSIGICHTSGIASGLDYPPVPTHVYKYWCLPYQ